MPLLYTHVWKWWRWTGAYLHHYQPKNIKGKKPGHQISKSESAITVSGFPSAEKLVKTLKRKFPVGSNH